MNEADNRLRVAVVEVANVCNFSCPQCAYARPQNVRFMDINMFAQLAREAAEAGVELVRFLGLGEPTLHPRIGRLLRVCRAEGLDSHLISNGSFALRLGARKMILDDYPDLLEISLDAATPAAFHMTRGRDRAYFMKLTAAVRAFLAEGRPEGSRTAVSFVAHDETSREVGLFREQWVDLVDHVRIRAPHNFSGHARALASQGSMSAARSCSFLIDRIAVASDGTVSSCNLDFAALHVLGRVGGSSSLTQMWQDPRRLHLKASVEGGVLDAQCSGCSKCSGLA